MSFTGWLNNLRPTLAPDWGERNPRRRQSGPRPLTRRLEVEALEGRDLPSSYAFITLDPPDSTATNTNDSGINNSGEIVGRFVAGGTTHGYLLSGGTYTPLDRPGATFTAANGINDPGQIVGAFDVGGIRRGYLLSGGSYTTIDVAGSTQTVARGINDPGQIVGFAIVGGKTHGYLLSGGNYTTLEVPGATLTNAAKINNSGQIVGFADVGGRTYGFLLSGGTYTTLDFPGSTFTSTVAINNSGLIVGGYRDVGGTTHGFVLSGGIYTTLDFPGSIQTFAHGVNDSDQIVGSYLDAGGIRHGFLATLPTRVANVVVNDGSAQRSMVNSLTVTFDSAVTLDTGAFEVRPQDGSLVGVSVTTSQVGGRTVAVVTFTGSDVIGGSLADGNYALTILSDRIHDATGRPLDGDGDGAEGGDRVDSFFRLFGDSDGDGDVDRLDRDLFRSAFKKSAGEAGYLWYFDFDFDGDVDGRDNGQFNRRFGQY